MTKDVQHTYDSYLDAYRDIGPAERDRLLRQSVTAEVVSVNPNGEGLGFDNLVEHIQQFQERNPGAYFKANKLLTHHEQFLSEWTMYSKDGAVVTTAHTYGRLNQQGLITYLIGFFEQVRPC